MRKLFERLARAVLIEAGIDWQGLDESQKTKVATALYAAMLHENQPLIEADNAIERLERENAELRHDIEELENELARERRIQ